jgi:hypothetical protein
MGTSLIARGGQHSDSYLSLPLAERMAWVETSVIPNLKSSLPGQRLAVSTSPTLAMLRIHGAERLYPHADMLKITRMRSVAC